MTDLMILRVVARLLLPFILVFGLYVQAHGDYGPGGGFQAGVIFATGLILYGLVFGNRPLKAVLPEELFRWTAALGVLIYAGTGFAAWALGGLYLEYAVLAHDPAHGNHLGIFSVELGVGIGVSSVMMLLYYNFTGRNG